MIDRRRFVGVLAATAVVPLSGAQQPGKVYRIGYIQTVTPDEQAHLTKAFEVAVRELDYKTRDDARVSLFDYMEVFCNRQRRYSSVGYRAPLPFEAMKLHGKVSTVRG